MKSRKNVAIRYSEAFKHQIVSEVEAGSSCEHVRKKYGIGGYSTIQKWMKRLGKLGALPKIIRVEKPDEKEKLKELERQIRQLKNALAETQVRCVIAESHFEIVCEDHGLDPEAVKKKIDEERLSKP